ncbi:hypothetical protein [Marinicella sp. W31]|uniref:hypothetical protein n=1 Tax=Marinicella sp. W31 TaxID=3023713 RepID=UPI00375802DB
MILRIIRKFHLLIFLCFAAGCEKNESEQWCLNNDGKYEDNICTLPISKADCEASGGRLEDKWSCVMPMSIERCNELGGKLNNNKQCVVK